ncbi:MAG: hypothetical protein RL758_931 [Pseudomonadota bacterium]|jgi:hypothetical protein
MTTTIQALHDQQRWLDQLRLGQLSTRDYLTAARQTGSLMDALPDAFQTVWVNLLDRLESASLFSEESCSFSQTDLLDSLQLWLDKAGQRLKA